MITHTPCYRQVRAETSFFDYFCRRKASILSQNSQDEQVGFGQACQRVAPKLDLMTRSDPKQLVDLIGLEFI